MRLFTWILAAALILGLIASPSARADTTIGGPWDLTRLKQPVRVTWVDSDGPLRQLFYESEPVEGKPTRVFAYYAQPAKVDGRLPAMVLVHGGGGKAFPEWAKLWADRGYIALAMDLAGNGPDGKRLPDGGPGQGDDVKFPVQKTDPRSMWSYHAVAAVIRANSLLRSLPQVDSERIGVTGISWGGYLTCLVAGLDDRFKVAVPVYGCGFLHDNSVWLNRFAKMPAEWRKEWVANFDPSSYLKQARMPMLFVNGTNDFAYPLDSYQKSYRLAPNRQLCVTVIMPHGHTAGWAPAEIGLFADQHLRKGTPLPAFVGEMAFVRRGLRQYADIDFKSPGPLDKADVHWTLDTTGPWQKRKWETKEAIINEGSVRGLLPPQRPLIYFLTITDKRKATVSTEHLVMERE